MSEAAPQGFISRKAAEICFAAVLAVFGLVMIIGAREMETGWSSFGPEAGYFPLRIGSLIVVASLAVLALEVMRTNTGKMILSGHRAARNLALFALPLIALIAAIPRIGIYLAAVMYLAFAIGFIGKVRVLTTLAISLLTPLALFVLFEFIFRTPLPKGPLGPLLGML